MLNNSSSGTSQPSHPMNYQDQPCYFLPPIVQQNNLLFAVDLLICLLNSMFSFVGATGNFIVILTIWRTSSLHSPSMTLIGCLAFSDLVVAILVQPCTVVYRAARLAGNVRIYCTFGTATEILGWAASGTSFLTVTTIAVERYLHLHLHLRYEEVVTNTRVLILFTCFWFFYGIFSSIRFWISLYTYIIIVIIIFALSLMLSCFGYFHIFRLVRRHRKQIADDARVISRFRGENSPNIDLKIYQRSLVTCALVVAVYIVCHLPLIGTLSAYVRVGNTNFVEAAYFISTTIVFMNSTFNFVIYGWRVKEIRDTLQQIFNFSQSCQR